MGPERRGRAVHGRLEVNPSGEEPTDRPRQKNAGLWEPYDGRLSRTVLREREGEVPSRYSPRFNHRLAHTDLQLARRQNHQRTHRSTNNLIKRVKRAAFGFTNFANYRIRALLYSGKPNWTLLDTLTPP